MAKRSPRKKATPAGEQPAGRRRGEERRLRHDPFAHEREWSPRDQRLVRELFERPELRAGARALISQIRALARDADLERDALEALAHGLVRGAIDASSRPA